MAFWAELFHLLSTFLGMTLPPDPVVALSNKRPFHITILQFKLLLYVTNTSKQTLVKTWKTPNLSFRKAKHRVTQCMIHSKTEATLQDWVPTHFTIWQSWVDIYLPQSFDQSLLKPWPRLVSIPSGSIRCQLAHWDYYWTPCFPPPLPLSFLCSLLYCVIMLFNGKFCILILWSS